MKLFGNRDFFYVKQEVFGQKEEFRRRFVASARIGAIIAAVILIWVFVPRVFHWPVTVRVNGSAVRVPFDSTIDSILQMNPEWMNFRGDLLAVDGTVLEEGGGGSPRVSSRRKVLALDDRVRSALRISVSRGEDETEAVVSSEVFQKPPLVLKGKGPLRLVTNPGSIGLSIRYSGEISGKLQRSEEKRAVAPVTVRAKSAGSVKPKVVALTFDDGPNPEATEKILSILADEGVKATFFMQGSNAAKYPALAKKVADQGHQIGNHSQTHKRYTKLTPPEIEEDMMLAQKTIADATGVVPEWVRPPYGMLNANIYSICGAKELNLALWTLDPADWRKPGKSTIIRRVIGHVKPGAVILMHDGGGDRSQTVRALRPIVQWLKEEGYRFTTIQGLYSRIQ